MPRTLIAALALMFVLASCEKEGNPVSKEPAPKPVPGVPSLSAPANGAGNQDIPTSLAWNSSAGATAYGLQVSRNEGFTDIIYNTGGIGTTSQVVPALSPNTIYWWRVNALNASGTSAWSDPRRFTTFLLQAPTLAAPTNRIEGQPLTVTLTWNPAAHATGYEVQVSTDSLFARPARFMLTDSSLDVTNRAIEGLDRSSRYFWRIRSTLGKYRSAWSPTWSFRTLLSCDIVTVSWGGSVYATVSIGNQCWLARNMDEGVMIASGTQGSDDGTAEKYCYNDDPGSCEENGGLFSWYEAMQYSAAPAAQGLCPDGWHIPTRADIEVLTSAVNDPGLSRQYVSTTEGGTNETGFSARLSGYFDFGYFGERGDVTKFWLSEQDASQSSFYWILGRTGYGLVWPRADKNAGYSVRCIRD